MQSKDERLGSILFTKHSILGIKNLGANLEGGCRCVRTRMMDKLIEYAKYLEVSLFSAWPTNSCITIVDRSVFV
jgi:hypothetical protein